MISEACWPQQLINEIQRYQTNEKSEWEQFKERIPPVYSEHSER